MGIPHVYDTDAELLGAVAACEGAASMVAVLGSAEELGELLGPDVLPVGFIRGRNRGAALVTPEVLVARLRTVGREADAATVAEIAAAALEVPLGEPWVFSAAPGAWVMLSSLSTHLENLRVAALVEAATPPGTRAARRLAGEPELHAAVAWAESIGDDDVQLGSSDSVWLVWGVTAEECFGGGVELPAVGAFNRALRFEVVAAEEFRRWRRRHPGLSRVAFYVGRCLVRVWTATGGAAGGPAELRLEDGERRADVFRGEGGA